MYNISPPNINKSLVGEQMVCLGNTFILDLLNLYFKICFVMSLHRDSVAFSKWFDHEAFLFCFMTSQCLWNIHRIMLLSSVTAQYPPGGSRFPWHMDNHLFIEQIDKGFGTWSIISGNGCKISSSCGRNKHWNLTYG